MESAEAPDQPGQAKSGRRYHLFRRLRRDGRGATMIEFALLMLPFFILIFGIFDVGLVIWGGLELDNATNDAARLVRTGQAQSGGYDANRLKQEVCTRVSLLFDCTTKLRLDVRTFATFASMNAPKPLTPQGDFQQNFSFKLGGPDEIVLMSTYYEWPLLDIVASMSLSNMASGNRLLQASAAFQNEPYPENQQ
jgi:Flp pilus assembly protein TadG